MGRISRPSVLKRQKEQKRLEKAARKREERQAKKTQKEEGTPEGTPLEPGLGQPETEIDRGTGVSDSEAP